MAIKPEFNIIWEESVNGKINTEVLKADSLLSAMSTVDCLLSKQSESYTIKYIYIVKITPSYEELMTYGDVLHLRKIINNLTNPECYAEIEKIIGGGNQ